MYVTWAAVVLNCNKRFPFPQNDFPESYVHRPQWWLLCTCKSIWEVTTPAKAFEGGGRTKLPLWSNLHGMKAVEDMACFIYYSSLTQEQNNINDYLWNAWPLHLLLLPLQDYSLVRRFLRLSQRRHQHCHQPFWTKRGGEKGRKGWTERSSQPNTVSTISLWFIQLDEITDGLLAVTENNRKKIVGLYLLYLTLRPLTPHSFLFNWAVVNTL